MPKPKISRAQLQKLRKQCYGTFDKALDSCLADNILTPQQCLEDAARQWSRCMSAGGVTIVVRSAGGKKPKPARKSKSRSGAKARRASR